MEAEIKIQDHSGILKGIETVNFFTQRLLAVELKIEYPC